MAKTGAAYRLALWLIGWLVAWLIGFALTAVAQSQRRTQSLSPGPPSSASGVPASVAAVITGAAARAGVIFAGQVLSIDREDAAGFVDVRFHVDQAVRGCGTADVYVLREWAGLWSGQAPRYREGERLLMLLAPRGRGGMSAPVDGLAGAIPLIAVRQQPRLGAKGAVPAETEQEDSPSEGVDLRWVETLATRRSVLPPATAMSHTGDERGEWRGIIESLHGVAKVGTPAAVVQPATSTLASVLALLGSGRVVAYPVDR